jgi:hypothetical protein
MPPIATQQNSNPILSMWCSRSLQDSSGKKLEVPLAKIMEGPQNTFAVLLLGWGGLSLMICEIHCAMALSGSASCIELLGLGKTATSGCNWHLPAKTGLAFTCGHMLKQL